MLTITSDIVQSKYGVHQLISTSMKQIILFWTFSFEQNMFLLSLKQDPTIY